MCTINIQPTLPIVRSAWLYTRMKFDIQLNYISFGQHHQSGLWLIGEKIPKQHTSEDAIKYYYIYIYTQWSTATPHGVMFTQILFNLYINTAYNLDKLYSPGLPKKKLTHFTADCGWTLYHICLDCTMGVVQNFV